MKAIVLSQDDLEFIKSHYAEYRSKGVVCELLEKFGIGKTYLHKLARSLGLTDRKETGKWNTTHGTCGNLLYDVYKAMQSRCGNPNSKDFPTYGARGITVCEEWLSDIHKFIDWAESNGYKKGLKLDRIDNNGNYEPSNCRWANDITQARNKSNNIITEYNGKSMTIPEISNLTGINYRTLKQRYYSGLRGSALVNPSNIQTGIKL